LRVRRSVRLLGVLDSVRAPLPGPLAPAIGEIVLDERNLLAVHDQHGAVPVDIAAAGLVEADAVDGLVVHVDPEERDAEMLPGAIGEVGNRLALGGGHGDALDVERVAELAGGKRRGDGSAGAGLRRDLLEGGNAVIPALAVV